MTEEGNTGLTWERRLALWLPRPILFGAFLIAACLSAAYLIFQWFFDLRVERNAILMTMLIAFLLMMRRYTAPADVLERQRFGLELPLSDGPETEVRALHLPRDKIRRSRLTGVAGALALAGVVEVIVVADGSDLVTPWIQLHDGSATMALAVLTGWVWGRSVPPDPWPLPQSSEIDLLNLEDLYAIGRRGLRGALVVFVALSIGSLVYLDTSLGLWGALVVFAMGLGLALFLLLRPAQEVRSLIRAAKREELAQLKPRVRQARDEALTEDASTQGRLTDLLAYQDRVESTREWPFDSSTLLRFGIYTLIPVGSMVGGALVERIVDWVLD